MSHVREILERALRLIDDEPDAWATTVEAESAIREALAALDAEGVGLSWVSVANEHPHPHDDVVLWSDLHGRWLWDGNRSELYRATHWLPLSSIPLPGQSPRRDLRAEAEAWYEGIEAAVGQMEDQPAPSAGLREAVERVRDMLRVRQALEPELTAADLAGRAADRLDAALRAEEQSHD